MEGTKILKTCCKGGSKTVCVVRMDRVRCWSCFILFELDCELQYHTVYIETTQASDSSHSDHTDRFQSSLQEAIKTVDLNSG